MMHVYLLIIDNLCLDLSTDINAYVLFSHRSYVVFKIFCKSSITSLIVDPKKSLEGDILYPTEICPPPPKHSDPSKHTPKHMQ